MPVAERLVAADRTNAKPIKPLVAWLRVMVLAAISIALWSRTTLVFADSPPQNLLQNGDFVSTNPDISLQYWTPLSGNTKAIRSTDADGTLISLNNPDNQHVAGLEQFIALRPEWGMILLKGKIRTAAATSTTGFVGIRMEWHDSNGRIISSVQAVSLTPASADWSDINELTDIPTGAVSLRVAPEVSFMPGKADFRDLSVCAWVQTMDDEFSGNEVDQNLWNISEGKHDTNANEQEWFSPDHVTVADGSLKIHADQKAHNDWRGNFPYESGDINSKGKFQQRYGVFEFRQRIPLTMGNWPASYLLGWNDSWPPEIDIEEYTASLGSIVLNTNHYATDFGVHRASSENFTSVGLDRTQWHTYGIAWQPGSLSYYFDGVCKGTTGKPGAGVSDVPMYIRINLAVGAFGADPTKGTWPQDYFCDWARVYQRSDSPLPLYPGDSQEITLPQNTATLSALSCNPIAGTTVTWSLADGPAQVTISDPHALSTTAIFSQPGMYRFAIRVVKGASSSSGEQLVYVNAPLPAS